MQISGMHSHTRSTPEWQFIPVHMPAKRAHGTVDAIVCRVVSPPSQLSASLTTHFRSPKIAESIAHRFKTSMNATFPKPNNRSERLVVKVEPPRPRCPKRPAPTVARPRGIILKSKENLPAQQCGGSLLGCHLR